MGESSCPGVDQAGGGRGDWTYRISCSSCAGASVSVGPLMGNSLLRGIPDPSAVLPRHHGAWRPGQAESATAGGAGRRTAKNAAAPMDQSREAHHPARPHHSPGGGERFTAPPGGRQVGWHKHGDRPACDGQLTVTAPAEASPWLPAGRVRSRGDEPRRRAGAGGERMQWWRAGVTVVVRMALRTSERTGRCALPRQGLLWQLDRVGGERCCRCRCSERACCPDGPGCLAGEVAGAAGSWSRFDRSP
jgi:hypothetical protein